MTVEPSHVQRILVLLILLAERLEFFGQGYGEAKIRTTLCIELQDHHLQDPRIEASMSPVDQRDPSIRHPDVSRRNVVVIHDELAHLKGPALLRTDQSTIDVLCES